MAGPLGPANSFLETVMMLRLLVALCLLCAAPALAHFSAGTQVREVVIDEPGGLIYVRAPLPLVFADLIDTATVSQTQLESSFLYVEQTGAGPRYRVNAKAVAADPEIFSERLAAALAFERGDERLALDVTAFRLIARRPDAPMDSASAARQSLEKSSTSLDPVFGEAVVDYALVLPTGATPSVRAALPAITLPDGVSIDNHLTLDTGQTVLTQMHEGQLHSAQSFPKTAFDALWSFTKHGAHHIITGLDHVFLVICFALGIGWSRRLLWVVTAFTLGHSVSLVLGSMEIVPAWSWFIPVIEIGIAGTVALAALAAWRGEISQGAAPAAMAGGVGLIHGFGFASFLSDSLSPTMPSFLPALAGFNIGLELGQMALVAVAVALFALIARTVPPLEKPARGAVLAAVGLVAAYWTVERAMGLIAA